MRGFAVAVVLLAAGSVARATQQEAKLHYDQAAKLYDLGEFKDALAEFKKAFLAHDDPVYLFNIAQCFRMLADHEHAALEYRAFLRRAPNAPNRARVEEFIALAEKEIQRHASNVSPTGTLTPAPPGATPPEPATVNAPPGTQPVIDHPTDPNAPPIATGPARDAPRPIYKRWWFWTAIGVVVVAAVVVGVVVGTAPGDAPIPSSNGGFTLLSFH